MTGPGPDGERRVAATGNRYRNAVGACVIAVLGAVVSWYRLPSAARGIVWAEDGGVFLLQWLIAPGLHVSTPYDGYLHVVPRLVVAATAAWAPPSDFATILTALCCIVVGLLTAVVWCCTDDVVGSTWVRAVLASTTFLAPPAATEVLGNAANLHWYFLWSALWVVLHRPRTWTGAVVLSIVALLAGLTEIQCALWVVLGVLVWVRRGRPGGAARWRQAVVHIALLTGVVCQVGVTLASPRPVRAADVPSVLSVAEGFLVGPVLGAFTGRAPVQGQLLNATGWWLPVLALVTVLVAAGVAARQRGVGRHAVLGCVAGALTIFTAAVVLNPSVDFAYDTYSRSDWAVYGPVRYIVVPAMLLLAVSTLAADRLIRSARRAPHGLGAVLLALLVVVMLANSRPAFTARDGQENWAEQVDKGLRQCDRGKDPVVLGIAPGDTSLTVGCAGLRAWSR